MQIHFWLYRAWIKKAQGKKNGWIEKEYERDFGVSF